MEDGYISFTEIEQGVKMFNEYTKARNKILELNPIYTPSVSVLTLKTEIEKKCKFIP